MARLAKQWHITEVAEKSNHPNVGIAQDIEVQLATHRKRCTHCTELAHNDFVHRCRESICPGAFEHLEEDENEKNDREAGWSTNRSFGWWCVEDQECCYPSLYDFETVWDRVASSRRHRLFEHQ